MKKIVWGVVLGVVLSGCSDDPGITVEEFLASPDLRTEYNEKCDPYLTFEGVKADSPIKKTCEAFVLAAHKCNWSDERCVRKQ